MTSTVRDQYPRASWKDYHKTVFNIEKWNLGSKKIKEKSNDEILRTKIATTRRQTRTMKETKLTINMMEEELYQPKAEFSSVMAITLENDP